MEYETAKAARIALAMDVPVSDRLCLIAENFRTRLPAYTHAMDNLVARLHAGHVTAGIPRIGETFPDFILPDVRGRL